MTHYRLYLHDSHGHFLRAEDILSATDDDALQFARELKHDHPVEVWQRERKVGMAAPVRNAGWLSRFAFGADEAKDEAGVRS